MTVRVPYDPRKPFKSPVFAAWLRQHATACANCGAPAGELHHHGPRGLGQKTDDTRMVPLCVRCHGMHSQGVDVLLLGPDDTVTEYELRMAWAQVDQLVRFIGSECYGRNGEPICRNETRERAINLKERRMHGKR